MLRMEADEKENGAVTKLERELAKELNIPQSEKEPRLRLPEVAS